MSRWKRNERTDPSTDEHAKRIAEKLLGLQRLLADQLNSKAKGMTLRNLVVLLMLMGIVFGSYCLWLSLELFR